MTLSDAVRNMTSDEVLEYEFHYLAGDWWAEKWLERACSDCEANMYEADINNWDCDARGDAGDDRCVRKWEFVGLLRYLIEADLELRESLGDML